MLVKRILEHREAAGPRSQSGDNVNIQLRVDTEVWPGRELSILGQMRPSISAGGVIRSDERSV